MTKTVATTHELTPNDFCQKDTPWCYFILAPIRSMDQFARLVDAEQRRSGGNPVSRILRGWRCTSPAGVHQEWAAALQFPYYFRRVWDGFDECITDLEWLPATCYTFFVTEVDLVLPDFRKDFSILINILQSAAREWKVPNRYNTNEPTASFTVVFHAEPENAVEALARLRAAGADPIVSHLSAQFLANTAER